MPIATSTAALIAAGLGAGTTAYGINKQSKDQRGADATNRAAIEKADQGAWNNYLLQRGLNTGGTAPTGVIPVGAAPVNAKLPLWMNVTTRAPALPQSRWVKKGTAPTAPSVRLAT